jgi:hypothetical protein
VIRLIVQAAMEKPPGKVGASAERRVFLKRRNPHVSF